MLIDKHNRTIDYLRLAVTDKCNLRCFYCMPEEGIKFVRKEKLLSFEEMIRIITLLSEEGVNKIRITGGEPFLRKGIMSFLDQLTSIDKIDKVAITTNGTLTTKYLDDLIKMGITSYNLSIDTVDKQRFYDITRRDSFDDVWACYQMMLDRKVNLKLNAVVMANRNIDDLIPMIKLGMNDNVSIRFIEEMPFNGDGSHYAKLEWDHIKILQHIEDHFGNVIKLEDPKNSTSFNYKVDGFKGSFGIIPAYTRSFCGSCNRLRLTPQGTIKTCLYDDGIFNLRDLLRAGASDTEIITAVKEAVGQKAKDGFEAERSRKKLPTVSESMATIGG